MPVRKPNTSGMREGGTRLPRLAVFFLVCWLLPGHPAAGDEAAGSEPEVWIESARWSVELPPDAVLRVANELGDIRGRSSGDDKLLVAATIQRFAVDQHDSEVLISSEGGEVSVRTRYPSAEKRRPDGRLNGRIDLAVLVPSGKSMIVETQEGLIEVKGVDRDLSAKTGSGRIRVTTRRALDAETGAGELVAVIRKPGEETPARVKTGSGRLLLDVLNRPDLSLLATTGGSISKRLDDYEAATLVRQGSTSDLRLGKAPWFLEASSKTGSIQIRALPANELR